ncbi:hypothetical protein NEFER03_1706 [Nematocida sp. LUAm3]|nr:hypothetical protein NEFER03_1706 [Nematocida sp. LUAm3]KAI5175696.1 hypothetical protein NEFER02_1583 [Nematocida sp. LUAm2]KAI5178602.1 hypothetical protein NEFER01_1738 [Nematocida sp. LUAm1]
MRPRAEIFGIYVAYVLLYSFFHSSEEKVILGRPYHSSFHYIEMKVIDRFGCIIPYSLVYTQLLRNTSLLGILGVLSEIVAYIVVKDTLIVYVKEMNIFISGRSQIPLNPSGHTFMFLNGVYILIPVLFVNLRRRSLLCILSSFVIYEYTRLLIETVTYHHTFYDVSLGVIFFYLFRAVTNPIRRAYGHVIYTNEWSEREYAMGAVAICLLGTSTIIYHTYTAPYAPIMPLPTT